MFSKKSDEWATPQNLFDKLNEEFGFTLDPCATKENAKCEKYFTQQEDGLSKSWKGETVFCNPPYSQIKEWVKKCYDEAWKVNRIVLLIPARTDTRYFHDYIYRKSEIRFIKGRLKFGDSKNSAPFPSMIVIF
jgi:site-specific DNA-methyltransferase (adenine-specific)